VTEISLDYEYCEVAYIRIVLQIEDGVSEEISEEITQYPAIITPPSNLELRNVDNNLTISWEEPADLSKCEGLTYEVTFVTDSDTPIPAAIIDGNSHTVDYDSFCLQAEVSVATIYDGVTGEPEQKSYEESSDVINLDISSSIEGLLTIWWADHPKKDSCSLSYTVYYRVGDEDYADVTPQDGVKELEWTYECQVAYIRFVFVTEDGASQEIIEDITQSVPDIVGPVKNIGVTVTEGADSTSATITWESPDYVRECTSIVYTVSATDADGEPIDTQDCFITDECVLTSATDFCSATIYVTSTLTSITDASHPYTCDSSLFRIK